MKNKDLYGKIAPGEFYRVKGIRLLSDATKEQMELKIGKPEVTRHFLKYFHLFDKAHLTMLSEEGIISKQDVAKSLIALREMEKVGVEEVRQQDGHGMHSGESYLIQKLGFEVGGRIHIGRSSGDLTVAAGRLKVRSSILDLMDALLKYRGVLLQKSEDHINTVMPYYTMYQHAQPTTFAHLLLRWENPMARDFLRLQQAYCSVNQSSVGSAGLIGSEFPLNRKRMVELMGFDGLIENTMDANFSLDYGFDVYGVLSSIMATLDQTARDLFIFYTYEFRMIDFADEHCGTSSIMPQKKNPHVLMKATDNIRKVYGSLNEFIFETRGIVTGGKNGLAKELLWQAIDLVIESLEIMSSIFPPLRVNEERMRELAGAFWAQASDLAGVIVREKGLPFRTAHQITGIIVRKSIERSISPRDLTTELIDESAMEYMAKPLHLNQEVIDKVMDPMEIVKARTLIGGPAPVEVRRQISKSKEQLGQDIEKPSILRDNLKKAEEKLERAIDKLIAEYNGEL